MKSDTIDVSIILVGLNACNFIKQCISSILNADWHNFSYEVIYVDNGSQDDTITMLSDNFKDTKVIVNQENLGYCRAANQGSQIARGRHLFFLNDDTIILDEAVPLLVEALDTMSHVGVIGSRLLYPDLTEQWSGRAFPTVLYSIFGRRSFLTKLFPNAKVVRKYLCMDELEKGVPFEVDWVSAAAMLVPREDFDIIGGLAEDYYYWHEAVFCDRLARLGKKTYLHPQSKIIHYEGKGSGKRPYAVQKFHIINFHVGAFRCYCQHFNLSQFSLRRLFAASTLFTRASLLLTGCWVKHKIINRTRLT